MTIPLTNYDDIVRHFELLGLHKGQAIVVHSKLLSFGRINGGVESVFKALQQVVGDKGTLVFPTYTLNLSSEDVYNPDTTPSYGMGALSEYVRKIPGVLRSNCPMHNHCALGPLAEIASKHNILPQNLVNWKKTFLANAESDSIVGTLD